MVSFTWCNVLRFIQVAVQFVLVDEYSAIQWIYHILCIHWPADE